VLWLTAFLALALWCVLWVWSRGESPAHPDALVVVWRGAPVAELVFLGVRWSVGVLDMARPACGLQAGRARALANAAAAAGSALIALDVAAAALLAGVTGAAIPPWTHAAEAAMAFTFGASLMMSVMTSGFRGGFLLPWLVLPVAGYLLCSPQALAEGHAPALVYTA
jgi:hypothetical protein